MVYHHLEHTCLFEKILQIESIHGSAGGVKELNFQFCLCFVPDQERVVSTKR